MVLINQRVALLEIIDPNPWQTRKNYDKSSIEELARDILANTLLQVPVGRNMDNERVELAFGHRRFEAFKLLAALGHDEFKEFPVIIKQLSDEQMALLAFSENEKRQDLNPVERAEGLRKMKDDFQWTQEQVAEKTQIDRSSVSNALRMLRMPEKVLDVIRDGILPVRSAMALLPFYDLTPLEMNVIERTYPDCFDFLALARSGELNSDTIRKQIDTFLAVLKPTPSEQLILESAREESIQAEEILDDETDNPDEEQNEELSHAEPAENIEESIDPDEVSEDESEDEAVIDHQAAPEEQRMVAVTEEEHAEKHGKTPTQPGPMTTVVADKVTPAEPAKETTLTVTWNPSGGVMIGYRKAGETAPKILFKQELLAGQFADLLAELGIE